MFIGTGFILFIGVLIAYIKGRSDGYDNGYQKGYMLGKKTARLG